MTTAQALESVLNAWVNGRKVRDGIPLTIRQQAEQALLTADAQATVEALQKKYDYLLGKYHQLMDFYDKHNGTPCEQIRHEQQVEALQRENECKDTLIETLQAQLAQRGKDGENE